MTNMKEFERIYEESQVEDILEIANQVIKDMRILNQLLFDQGENFDDKENNQLREMSQKTDNEIKKLMKRIENNLIRIGNAIGNRNQIIPHDKENMDKIMVGIMNQYIFTSNSIISDNILGENYAEDLNKIHSALNNLNDNINRYNTELAKTNNWPKIISTNEALLLAKQQINSQS